MSRSGKRLRLIVFAFAAFECIAIPSGFAHAQTMRRDAHLIRTQFVKTADTNARSSADAGTSFLMTLKRVWNDHTTSMLRIRDILMYMVCDLKYSEPSIVHIIDD